MDLISLSFQPSWGSVNSPPARVYTGFNRAKEDLAGEGVDFSMALHWFFEKGEAYLSRVERDFSAEVQRKRLRIGASVDR